MARIRHDNGESAMLGIRCIRRIGDDFVVPPCLRELA